MEKTEKGIGSRIVYFNIYYVSYLDGRRQSEINLFLLICEWEAVRSRVIRPTIY
jgi:hypothetical protein